MLIEKYRGALAVVVGAASLVQPELLAGEAALLAKMATDAAKKGGLSIAQDEAKKIVNAIAKDISEDADLDGVKDEEEKAKDAEGEIPASDVAGDEKSKEQEVPIEKSVNGDIPKDAEAKLDSDKLPAAEGTKDIPQEDSADSKTSSPSTPKPAGDHKISIQPTQAKTDDKSNNTDSKPDATTVSLNTTIGADGEVKSATQSIPEPSPKTAEPSPVKESSKADESKSEPISEKPTVLTEAPVEKEPSFAEPLVEESKAKAPKPQTEPIQTPVTSTKDLEIIKSNRVAEIHSKDGEPSLEPASHSSAPIELSVDESSSPKSSAIQPEEHSVVKEQTVVASNADETESGTTVAEDKISHVEETKVAAPVPDSSEAALPQVKENTEEPARTVQEVPATPIEEPKVKDAKLEPPAPVEEKKAVEENAVEANTALKEVPTNDSPDEASKTVENISVTPSLETPIIEELKSKEKTKPTQIEKSTSQEAPSVEAPVTNSLPEEAEDSKVTAIEVKEETLDQTPDEHLQPASSSPQKETTPTSEYVPLTTPVHAVHPSTSNVTAGSAQAEGEHPEEQMVTVSKESLDHLHHSKLSRSISLPLIQLTKIFLFS